VINDDAQNFAPKYRPAPVAQSNIINVRPVQSDSAGAAESVWSDRPGGESDAYLRTSERAENFPVALRVLPREPRTHLKAVYDVARVIDDLGDEAPSDRVALLTAFRDDLATIWDGGSPRTPVLCRLAPTVAACGLTREPFENLVDANLMDQTRKTYPRYADLAAYCELSANPIGRIVLEVFGASTPANVASSDGICTALQIIEHCQDVAEDRRAGRIYLPQEDLDRFGVRPADLDVAPASPELRRLVAFEVDRCAGMLDDGLPLIGRLHGWARLAVAGYMAGGRAAIVAIRRAQCDVMSTSPTVGRFSVIQEITRVLRGRRVAT
jgi:squalene synthase HpnC